MPRFLTRATKGYVYIRHEYYEQIRVMNEAIAAAQSLGVLGGDVLGSGRRFELEVFESPGGYICGEQEALVEAIEERRAEPRNKPPSLETNGLFDKPTVLNNVETFAWVPAIFLNGAPGMPTPECRGRPGIAQEQARGQGPAVLLGLGRCEPAGRVRGSDRIDSGRTDRPRGRRPRRLAAQGRGPFRTVRRILAREAYEKRPRRPSLAAAFPPITKRSISAICRSISTSSARSDLCSEQASPCSQIPRT